MRDKVEGFPDVRADFTSRSVSAKGTGPQSASYAKGGGVLTERSQFMKTPDSFRTDAGRQDYTKSGKGGTLSDTEGDSKSLKPIKPRT